MDQSIEKMTPARNAGRHSDSERTQATATGGQGTPEDPVLNHTYSKRDLSYATTFDNKLQATFIRAMELFTGKLQVFRMIRKFERMGAPTGIEFWTGALKAMGIDVLTPQEQIDRIPKTGPVIVVANHTHGLVDGMIMAHLIGSVRSDFQILTRSVLTGLDQAASSFLIPVPFPHEPDAQQKGKEMRAKALERLREGGVVALFPSGIVAASDTWFGPPVEAEWNVFTAQLIRKTGATVVPMRFRGGNTRAYNIANKISATLRQGLLIHEIVKACNKPASPTIGEPLTEDQLTRLKSDPRGFIAWLRNHTLTLTD